MKKIWLGVFLGIMSVIALGVVCVAGVAGAYYWAEVAKMAPIEAEFKKCSAEFAKHAHEAIEAWPDAEKFQESWARLEKDWRAIFVICEVSPSTFGKRVAPLYDVWAAIVATHSFLQLKDILQQAIIDEDKSTKEFDRLNKELAAIRQTKVPAPSERQAQEHYDRANEDAQEQINRAAVYLERIERNKWW